MGLRAFSRRIGLFKKCVMSAKNCLYLHLLKLVSESRHSGYTTNMRANGPVDDYLTSGHCISEISNFDLWHCWSAQFLFLLTLIKAMLQFSVARRWFRDSDSITDST